MVWRRSLYCAETTKSGLVSQYAAEQIRLEQKRDRVCFDAAVKDIRVQREAHQRTKLARLQLQPSSKELTNLELKAGYAFAAPRMHGGQGGLQRNPGRDEDYIPNRREFGSLMTSTCA
jgi:hypothetical protein